jgi:hypothetical protein
MRGRVIQANFGGGQPRRIAPPPSLVPRAPAGSMQAKAGKATPQSSAPEVLPLDPLQLGLIPGGGRPLPSTVLAKMEAAFRQDFSAVRVHEGPQAARIGALAFTLGNDIYFAPGRFDPNSIRGQQLIGHELAHVVQQRQGRVPAQSSGLALVHDGALEREADRLGQRAAMHAGPATIGQLSRAPGMPRHLPGGQRMAQPMMSMLKSLFGGGDKGGGGPSKDPPKELPKVVIVKPVDLIMEQIHALEEMHPENIVVAYGSVDNGNKAEVLQQMQRFVQGGLRVWRGVQQCHPQFPLAPYTHITAKVPASVAPPDFGDNNNNWIPFYEDQNACISVALSWSGPIAGYFRGRGGMDSNRACALLLERTLSVHTDRVAFGMAPEVQVWGPTTAMVVTQYGIDDDWSVVWVGGPHLLGTTFRAYATASNVPIN